MTRHLIVIGAGMAAHRLVESLRARDEQGSWKVSVFGEESSEPYDRVALTSYFSVRDIKELTLGDPTLWDDPLVTLHRRRRITSIDRAARTVTDHRGDVHSYDDLVIATGSSAAVPPIPGADLPGVFVYRTLHDVAALRGWVEQKKNDAPVLRGWQRPVRGAILGGGLLGIEAAGALRALGAQATILQSGTHLMNAQIDLGGGEALKRILEGMGMAVRCEAKTTRIRPERATGHVGSLELQDQGRLECDVVVIATGIRPRDELVRSAGLPLGEYGGVAVDATCRTADPGSAASPAASACPAVAPACKAAIPMRA